MSPDLIHAALPDSRIVVMQGQHCIAMSIVPELFVRLVTNILMRSS
jgi:hypothetical protein